MPCFQLKALRSIEICATFAGSDTPQTMTLSAGECRESIRFVHSVVESGRRIVLVPHPTEIGGRVTLDGVMELEQSPANEASEVTEGAGA